MFLSVALATITILAADTVLRVIEEWQALAQITNPDDSKQTLKQISKALVAARTDDKRVLLQFGSRSCTWCQLLHNLFDNDESIAGELKKDYVVIMVDVSDENNKRVDERYGHPIRDGIPVSVFLDSNGKQLLTTNIAFADSQALSNGIARVDPSQVLAFLKKLSHKDVSK